MSWLERKGYHGKPGLSTYTPKEKRYMKWVGKENIGGKDSQFCDVCVCKERGKMGGVSALLVKNAGKYAKKCRLCLWEISRTHAPVNGP